MQNHYLNLGYYKHYITIGKGKDREAVSLKRLQQLRIKEPSIVMKDDRHEMVDVGLDDPDFDVVDAVVVAAAIEPPEVVNNDDAAAPPVA